MVAVTDEPIDTGRRRRGPAAQTLDEAEQQRLAAIRSDATGERAKLAATGPGDALGSLAWLSGVLDPTTGQTLLAEAMDRARAEGFTWRQIAQALDEGDSAEDGRRIMDRRKSWTTT